MRTTLWIAAVAALSVSVNACKKPEPVKVSLAQNYRVTFFQYEAQTSAQASFSVYPGPGAPIAFQDRSVITANGQTDQMNLTSSSSNSFNWNFSGTPDVTFGFRQTDKTIYNTVSRSSMGALSWVVDTAYNKADTIVAIWEGDPLISGDIVSAYISTADSSIDWFGAEGVITGNKVVFDYLTTKNFPAGTYEVTLAKNRTFQGQNKDGDAPVTIDCALYARTTLRLR
jgi:hypothetical protein